MQWLVDTGRRELPCSGGLTTEGGGFHAVVGWLMTLEGGGGASMQWWADDTGRRGFHAVAG